MSVTEPSILCGLHTNTHPQSLRNSFLLSACRSLLSREATFSCVWRGPFRITPVRERGLFFSRGILRGERRNLVDGSMNFQQTTMAPVWGGGRGGEEEGDVSWMFHGQVLSALFLFRFALADLNVFQKFKIVTQIHPCIVPRPPYLFCTP